MRSVDVDKGGEDAKGWLAWSTMLWYSAKEMNPYEETGEEAAEKPRGDANSSSNRQGLARGLDCTLGSKVTMVSLLGSCEG